MSNLRLTLHEFRDTAKSWRIWTTLAWQDIKLRYRRSTLGPLWITISMAITIYTMGFLYGHLFNIDVTKYFPFLASGMITWALISSIFTESTNVFIEGESFLRNLRLPYTVLIARCMLRNLIIFLHNLIAIVPVYFIFHIKLTWNFIFVISGIIIIMINGVLFGSVLGYLGTRYRDLSQIIISMIQIIFFLTPIMWMPEILPEKYRYLLLFNPFFHYINLIRNPLIGKDVAVNDYVVTAVVTLSGILLFMYLFKFARNRLVFWL